MNIFDRKIWAGGLATAAAYAICWVIQSRLGIVVPQEAIAGLLVSVYASVAWAVPPAVKDIVGRIDGTIVEIIAKDPTIPLEIAKPSAPVPTKVVNGMTGRPPISVLLALVLILPLLGACSTVKTVESAAPAVTTTPITQAVQAVKEMQPEERWRLTCAAGDGLYIGYVAIAAHKLSDQTNAKVQGVYEGFRVLCANKPTDYATAMVSLIQAFNAFKAAIPAKAS